MSPLSTFLDGRPPTRGLLWLALTETGRVLVRSSVSDGGGGTTETYTPLASASWASSTNVACRIDPIGGGRGSGQGEVAGRISDLSTHVVTLPVGTSVKFDDDFQIQGLGRFEITAIRRHTGEFVRQIEVTDRTET